MLPTLRAPIVYYHKVISATPLTIPTPIPLLVKTNLADSSCEARKIAKERVFVQIGILTVILKGVRLCQTIVNKVEWL